MPDERSPETHFPNGISLLSSQLAVLTLLTGFLAFLGWFVHRIRLGYREFLALGPGGTPSTFSGYLRICVLRIFVLKDPLVPPRVPQNLRPQNGILNRDSLAYRKGPRPKVKGIAPQRQMSQQGSQEMYELLSESVKTIAAQSPDSLYLGISRFEKHSTGLLSLPNLQTRTTCKGEICHSHSVDGSMHLTLHPDDVKMVLERGWGERHPLAREEWWWGRRCVPSGFMMIYAPRSREDLEYLRRIIYAASWWVTGMEPWWTKPGDTRHEQSQSGTDKVQQPALRVMS